MRKTGITPLEMAIAAVAFVLWGIYEFLKAKNIIP